MVAKRPRRNDQPPNQPTALRRRSFLAASRDGKRKGTPLSTGVFRSICVEMCEVEIRRGGDRGQLAKVAAFDLDGTLVQTKGTSPFPRDASDWLLFHPNVITELQRLHEDGFRLVIFSNQGGIRSKLDGPLATRIKKRIDQILKEVRRVLGSTSPKKCEMG